MRSVVVDGDLRGGGAAAACAALTARQLAERGDEVASIVPRHLTVGACSGCFGCWVSTPGVCANGDDGRAATEALVTADLVVVVGPVTFGGHSSAVKAVLDRSIGTVSPLFTTVQGETRHRARYRRHPVWATIGLQAVEDRLEARVFREVAARNARNLHAAGAACGVFVAGGVRAAGDVCAERLAERIRETIERAEGPAGRVVWSAGVGALDSAWSPDPRPGERSAPPPRTALLLVGSPRGRRSTSASLGEYLGIRLREAGLTVTPLSVGEAAGSDADDRRLREAFAGADLVLVLSPLYVDALPAPVTRAFEMLGASAGWEAGDDGRGPAAVAPTGHGPRRVRRLAAIVNSGFPEVWHNHTALAICATFARRTGMRWEGGLALGAGALLGGRPLEEAGAMTEGWRRSLDLTARALAAGQAVPGEAVSLLAEPVVPYEVYRYDGDRQFRRTAAKRGVADRLGDRPYAATG